MADVEQLIRRHLSGDREATAQIIRAFRPLAVDQAMRTCGDREVAQDAAQEALVQALKHVEGLKEVERFPQWLATIARNEGHRSRRRRADVMIDVVDGITGAEVGHPPGPPGPATEDGFWGTVTENRTRDALSRLPSRLRRVLELRHFHGCSYEEIADELGITPSTAKGRLQMARDLFREWYAELESCDECDHLLAPFLAGQLDLESVEQVYDHLFGCRECMGRLLALAEARAEVLLQRIWHWHGAIDELRLGLAWQLPRLQEYLLDLVHESPHNARPWMLLHAAFGIFAADTRYGEAAFTLEPETRLGEAARMWTGMLQNKLDEYVPSALRLREHVRGRSGTSVHIDRIQIALAVARGYQLELLPELLDETLDGLSAETFGPRGPDADLPTEAAGTEGVHQKIHAIEGLMMDRDPDALYGVMLLQQHVGGEYSDDARRMQRAVMAMRPLDAGHLGQVVNGFLAEGDTERASRWIGYGLAQFQLRPCRTQMGWVAPAICAVARAGELDAAVNHAKDYVSKLRPDERNAAILTLAPAIPNALELLADLPDAPALPGRR